MYYKDLKSIHKPLLFLRFGVTRLSQGVHEIEMEFMVLKSPIKSHEISSFNYLKYFADETISVWAPYKLIGEATTFDLYINGERTKRLCEITPTRTLYFNKSMIQYQFGLTGIFNPISCLEESLANQYFAYFKIEKENKYWIIPCSEIYTSYFGKFQSAIIQSTFEGIEIFDKHHTDLVNIEFSQTPYIKLRKQFTEASVKVAYRMYKDEYFEASFKKTRTQIHGDNKNLYAEFPFKRTNEVVANYIAISKTVNLVVQNKSIKSDFIFPNEIEYDTDNSPGKEIDENTVKTSKTRIKGAPKIEGEPSFSGNRANEILHPRAVSVRPDEDEYGSVIIKKISKEKKKTISEKIIHKVQAIDEDSYGESGLKNDSTIKRSHESESNNEESNYTFKNLENLKTDLYNSNEFSSVSYYKNKSSHELTNKSYSGINWPYLKKNQITRIWEGYRKIGLIQLNYRTHYLYILEIEKRRENENFSLGIIYTDSFSPLTEVQFAFLLESLITNSGSLQKMLLRTRISNSSINGKPLNHTKGKNRMVDRIIDQIKKTIPK